jgi:Trk-type K+ transport system membrane component
VKQNSTRALVEIGFILFLFYTNLLMGEFEHSGMGLKKGLWWALFDVFTISNLCIAAVAATIGWLLIEFLRQRF